MYQHQDSVKMNEKSIKLLAKWAINQGCHIYNDSDLRALLILDNVRKKVYEENRIKAPGGFTEASILAFEAVVMKVIEMEKQQTYKTA